MNNDWREYYDPQYVLMHHGIKGQKWGVRQYQNADGTLTEAGKKRYGSGADRVEKFARKAASWEGKAINAKTGIGRSFAATMAADRRAKADKLGAKATGNYKMFALNKNASRSLGASAEAHANVAAGLKAKADASSGKQKEKILNNAVKYLATAENAETAAKVYNEVAKSPLLAKGGVFIREAIKANNKTYTSAGRKSDIADKVTTALGNAAIDTAFNIATGRTGRDPYTGEKQKGINVASNVNAVGLAKDASYRSKNSASKRWDKIMKG